MIIEKEIISQVYRPYFFITGIFDIDAKYFKKKNRRKCSTFSFKL